MGGAAFRHRPHFRKIFVYGNILAIKMAGKNPVKIVLLYYSTRLERLKSDTTKHR